MSDIIPPVERRQSILSALSGAKIYIVLAIALCIVQVIANVVLAVLRPGDAAAVATIRSSIEPIIWALLGAGGIGVLKVVDGNTTKLMHAIGRKERAEGELDGLKKNPNVNIE